MRSTSFRAAARRRIFDVGAQIDWRTEPTQNWLPAATDISCLIESCLTFGMLKAELRGPTNLFSLPLNIYSRVKIRVQGSDLVVDTARPRLYLGFNRLGQVAQWASVTPNILRTSPLFRGVVVEHLTESTVCTYICFSVFLLQRGRKRVVCYVPHLNIGN